MTKSEPTGHKLTTEKIFQPVRQWVPTRGTDGAPPLRNRFYGLVSGSRFGPTVGTDSGPLWTLETCTSTGGVGWGPQGPSTSSGLPRRGPGSLPRVGTLLTESLSRRSLPLPLKDSVPGGPNTVKRRRRGRVPTFHPDRSRGVGKQGRSTGGPLCGTRG